MRTSTGRRYWKVVFVTKSRLKVTYRAYSKKVFNKLVQDKVAKMLKTDGVSKDIVKLEIYR